jgi:signal transduction histidine kinase
MDRLLDLISEALDLARSERRDAGRSAYARHLSIAITDLEVVEDRVGRAIREQSEEMAGGLSFPGSTLADEAHAGQTGPA